MPIVAENSVGTVDGTLNVSESGAAVYSIPLDVFPSGTGFDPQIGLAYNSQHTGYGNAGYGVSITGISCITRTGNDQFHDNTVQKIRYEAGDNYLLDGKRLYLKNGTKGMDGSTYTVEGNPYATVTLHGNDIKPNYSVWFELHDADGKIYHYNRRYSCFFGHPTKSYLNVAWYITEARDKYDNRINYQYTEHSNCIYPTKITYGRFPGMTHTITFAYDDLSSPQPFMLEGGVRGYISKKLSEVTSTCRNEVYRQYSFFYNTSSDASIKKYDRLASVQVTNGNDEHLAPLTFNWNYLGGASVNKTVYNVLTHDPLNQATDPGTSFYFSADVNNDGISDILRVWSGEVLDYNTMGYSPESSLYISESHIGNDGSISFQQHRSKYLPPFSDLSFLFEMTLSNNYAGPTICNIDGDAFNDIIIPYTYTFDTYRSCYFFLVKGNSDSNPNTRTQNFQLLSTEIPVFGTIDLNCNGKDELIFVEKVRNGTCYNGKIVYNLASPNQAKDYIDLSFTYSQNKDIEKMFLADCNADGLQDIILVFDEGYKIYFNNGGTDLSAVFSESNSKEVEYSFTLKDYWRMEQGDFNGDGLVDFLVNTAGEAKLGFLFNNGDGTFTASTKINVDFADITHSTKDDNYFAIRVADFDKDGLSDFIVSIKHMYDASSWYEDTYYRQDMTQVRWFRSDGTKPVLWQSYNKSAEERDCYEANIFTGDFNGDGFLEIANYGSPLNSATNNTFTENTINIYAFPTNAQLGHISSITNGFGKTTNITYANGTDPSVYTKGNTYADAFPVNTYALPIPLVSSVTQTNGAAGTEHIAYSYEGLKVHLQGRGMLGFTSMTTDNTTSGIGTQTRITRWDQTRWLPLTIQNRTTYSNGTTTTSTSTNSIAEEDSWQGNYFLYTSESESTDINGRDTRTYVLYDLQNGVPTEECTYYGSGTDMYKKKQYLSYARYCGRYLPSTVISTQKHNDDTNLYTVTDNYVYDIKGDVTTHVSTSQYDGEPVTLTTDYTRDYYGNVITEHMSGSGVTDITRHNEYDSNKTRLMRTYTTPSSTVVAYSYDTFGNVTAERDETNPSNILTTSYSYDNWGRKVSTIHPDGTLTSTATSWDSSQPNSVYKTITTTSSDAPLTKYYDGEGREVYSSTYGIGNAAVTTSTTYNRLGKPRYVYNQTGNLSLYEQYLYDSFGRNVYTRNNDGSEISIEYRNDGNCTITSPTGNSARQYDDWGNVTRIENLNNSYDIVNYTYNSIGKPSIIDAIGSSITIGYDGAGRKNVLNDPDAGTQSYTYSADGKLLSQTDGNGVTTEITYDALGRQISRECGTSIIDQTEYGTSGNALNRVSQQTCNGYTKQYAYDNYGRVISETRTTDSGTFTITYSYNSNGQIASVTYPGNVTVTYAYDSNGNIQSASANGRTYFSQGEYNGLKNATNFFGLKNTERLYPSTGMTAYKVIEEDGGDELDRVNYTYYTTTKNVDDRWRGPIPSWIKDEWNEYISRGGSEYVADYDYWSSDWLIYDNVVVPENNEDNYTVECFQYDETDRLTSAWKADPDNLPEVKVVNYDENGNGNITYKTGIGSYGYTGGKPHAVSDIYNIEDEIVATNLTTSFNDDGKIECISQTGASGTEYMYFYYGPEREKWETVSMTSANAGNSSLISSKRHFYFGNYERIVENNTITEQYFLDNGVILIKKDGVLSFYQAFFDTQGSILSVFDEDGEKVFEASYDAWGRQTVVLNDIDLERGYCGHVMLPFDNLIDMGGRVYDSAVGRFLSCDNYVQEPENSQNFNRYSYCLNNPLRYVDPTGEFWWIIPAAIIGSGVVNVIMNADNIHNLGQGISYFCNGSASAAVAIYGGIAGVIGSGALLGAGNSIMTQGFANGIGNIDWGNVACSAIYGGITSGLSASIGNYVTSATSGWFDKISDITLRETLNGVVGGTTTGAAMGAIAYTNGADGSFLGNVGKGAVFGALEGSLGGFAMGKMKYSQLQKYNTTNLRARQINWPENEGALGEWQKFTLEPGNIIDRYGDASGRYASPVGTTFKARSISILKKDGYIEVYEVVKPITVNSSIIAPAFGQPGGGIQYKFTYKINYYIINGTLKLLNRK